MPSPVYGWRHCLIMEYGMSIGLMRAGIMNSDFHAYMKDEMSLKEIPGAWETGTHRAGLLQKGRLAGCSRSRSVGILNLDPVSIRQAHSSKSIEAVSPISWKGAVK